jgi:anti-sigma factor RsiW
MFCDEVLELIEPIAAGEVTPEGRVAAHLATCPGCAAALEDARRVERVLRAQPAPRAPAQFTTRVLSRVRRERWRSEQAVDFGFNVTIAIVAVGILAAAAVALHLAGMDAALGDAMNLVGSGAAALARRVAPSVPLYAGAAALLVMALGIWWWAERDAY